MEIQNYGLEGNSYMGKTTTLQELDGAIIPTSGVKIVGIPEYSNMLDIPAFRREDGTDMARIVSFFLDLERRRTELVTNTLAISTGDILFLTDRTVLSLILFEYGMKRIMGARDATMQIAEAFQTAISEQEIVIPRTIIHLTSSRRIFELRRAHDLSLGRGDCIPFLLHQGTTSIFDNGLRLWGSINTQQQYHRINTTDLDTQSVAGEVKNVLEDDVTMQAHSLKLVQFASTIIATDILTPR